MQCNNFNFLELTSIFGKWVLRPEKTICAKKSILRIILWAKNSIKKCNDLKIAFFFNVQFPNVETKDSKTSIVQQRIRNNVTKKWNTRYNILGFFSIKISATCVIQSKTDNQLKSLFKYIFSVYVFCVSCNVIIKHELEALY